MYHKKAEARPLCAWLFAGMTGPIALAAASQDPLSLLPVAAVCLGLCWCVFLLREGQCCERKWYCALELLWLAAAVGIACGWTEKCWPDQPGGTLGVPVVLTALAALAAWNGAERASRVGGTCFFLVALLYGIVLAGGVGSVRLEWLTVKPGLCDPETVFVFLIPAVITFLPRKGGRCYTPTLFALGIFALVLAALTTGALSPKVKAESDFPFYEFSKTMSLLDVAKRLESLVSVALTMGLFCLLNLLLTAAGHLAAGFGKPWAGIIVCAGAGLAISMAGLLPAGWLAGGGALLFWGILPLLTVRKKPEKTP